MKAPAPIKAHVKKSVASNTPMKAPAPIKAHVRISSRERPPINVSEMAHRGSRHQSCNENCNSLPETKLDDRIHPQ